MRKALLSGFIFISALLYFAPVLLTLTGSLMTGAEIGEIYESRHMMLRLIPRRITLEQYYSVLVASGEYVALFFRSLLLCSVITLLTVLVSTVSAYLFAKISFFGRDALFFVYIVVMLMPFQVTLLPNYILSKWLNIYDTWWSLVIPAVFSPLSVFLLRQFIINITDETLESAVLDTASPVVVLKNIVIPAIWPGILALVALQFAESWNMVEQPMILLETPAKYPLSLALNELIAADLSFAFAGAVIYMAPIVILFGLFKEELFDLRIEIR